MAAYDYRDCFNGVSLFLLSDAAYLSYRYYPYRSTIFLARVKILKGILGKMNRRQLIVVLGLGAYVIGGLFVVIFNLETFLKILQSQINLLIPILQVYIPILILGILIIYFLRDKKR